MKKYILSTLAAGALAAGGAVQAQDLPSQILGAIVGQGLGYNYGYNPGASNGPYVPPTQVLRDSNGRYFYYDAQGNVVYLNGSGNVVVPGAYGVQGAYGVPYAYGQQPYAVNPYRGDRDRDGIANRHDRDRDGDGVRNRDDRYPNNPRYR